MGNPIQEIIQLTSQRLTHNARDVQALHQRGDAYLAEGNFAAAEADYQRAIQLCLHTSSLAGDKRAQTLSLLYTQHSRAWLGLGDIDQADKAVRQALIHHPASLEGLLQRARLARQQGHLEIALAELDDAVKLAPENAATYRARAVVLWEMGAHEQALDDHNHALELDPDLASAWATRGKFYFELGDFKKAKKDFLRAVKLDKTCSEVYPFLAYFARMEGKAAGAEEIIQAGLQYQPENDELLYQAGYLYLSQGRLPETVETLSRYLALVPDNAKALAGRGQAYAQMEQFDAALQDFAHAALLAPRDPEIEYNRGLAYLHAGQPKGALLAMERVIELLPDHLEAHKVRAQILDKAGMPIFWQTFSEQPDHYQQLVAALGVLVKVAEKYYGAARRGETIRWRAGLIPMRHQKTTFIGVRLDMLLPLATVIDILAESYYSIKIVVGKDPVPGYPANQQRSLVNPKNITLETSSPFENLRALQLALEEAINDGYFVEAASFKPEAE